MAKNYSLDGLTAEAYGSFHANARKPLIGLTANHSDIDVSLRDAYHKQIVEAGGIPVLIPPVTDTDVVINTLEHLDGLVLTGGGDYNPLWCGEEPSPKLHNINAVRDSAELLITRLAFDRQIPMLGICRGMQTLAMALQGHVKQDIQAQQTVKHSQDADRQEPTHSVTVEAGSLLYNIYKENIPQLDCVTLAGQNLSDIDAESTDTEGQDCSESLRLYVNSFHHQAVDEAGPHFRAVAFAADGVVEAMESKEYKNVIGVQWHPEWLGKDGLPLFQWLVNSAAEYRRTVDLHSRIITLDTHCDTPMFFHQGVDFTKRDSRILVDLHKMTEGHLDATFMVCYLPQPYVNDNGAPQSHKGKSFSQLVHYDIDSPKAYADFIFDEIEKIVAAKPQYLALARDAEDLLSNKACGKKSIVLGIENGLALEGEIGNIQHFAERGVAYITLCHNGDNEICDSARGNVTHNGVSEFGERVIKEMNRLGIMVDMSHAAQSSFYDALQISNHPIVCSHSNCRALCDHPRNLTDDQLRALAQKGGVAHTTFYPGFLQKAGEADILDAVKHLEHAISIMGIDHVGIGTDFDGDGGVPGMADASEVMNFTRQLLRRRYSEADIQKIWGGNWLRVMKACRG